MLERGAGALVIGVMVGLSAVFALQQLIWGPRGYRRRISHSRVASADEPSRETLPKSVAKTLSLGKEKTKAAAKKVVAKTLSMGKEKTKGRQTGRKDGDTRAGLVAHDWHSYTDL